MQCIYIYIYIYIYILHNNLAYSTNKIVFLFIKTQLNLFKELTYILPDSPK
jgi:hypothetical protein